MNKTCRAVFAGVYLGRVMARLHADPPAVQAFLHALHSAMTEAQPVVQLYSTVTQQVRLTTAVQRSVRQQLHSTV